MKRSNKILITGGHAGTTALAVIEEIKKRGTWKDVSWIGNKRAIENADVKTLESKLFADLDIDYFEIDSGRLQRRWSTQTINAFFKTPKSFLSAYKIVSEIKPDLVLSFGGAVSLPVVFTSWIMGVPIIIHEQTIEVGLANKLSSVFAEKIALARLESLKHFNQLKCVHVGNPINTNLRKLNRKPASIKGKPTIYITGGSRGSQRINNIIFESLEDLVKRFKVIHQTGDLDFEKAEKLKKQFKNYKPLAFVYPKDLKKILQKTDIVVSRSGANTVAELIAFYIPSILIPIPWTRYDEQTKNALLAKKAGVSIVLAEDKMSKKSLLKAIKNIMKNYDEYSQSKNLETTSKDLIAHENLVNLMEEVIQ